MSVFSALTQLSSAINNSVMGERVRVTPKASASPYKAAGADPDRATVEAVGIYREFQSKSHVSDNAAGKDFNRSFLTPKIVISIRRADLGAHAYRAKDILTRLEQPGEPQFEIVSAEPVDDGRIAFTVDLVSL